MSIWHSVADEAAVMRLDERYAALLFRLQELREEAICRSSYKVTPLHDDGVAAEARAEAFDEAIALVRKLRE